MPIPGDGRMESDTQAFQGERTLSRAARKQLAGAEAVQKGSSGQGPGDGHGEWAQSTDIEKQN